MEDERIEHYVESTDVAHQGPKITLGGREHVLAPLPLMVATRMIPQITGLQVGMAEAQERGDSDAVMKKFEEFSNLGLSAIFTSLVRNYPKLSRQVLGEELLDQDNFGPILAQVLNRAQTPLGERLAAGLVAESPSPTPPVAS